MDKLNITGSHIISKELIDKVIQDERWSYEMPFFEFTKLLKFYSGLIEDPIIGIPNATKEQKPAQDTSSFLHLTSTDIEKDEIDRLTATIL